MTVTSRLLVILFLLCPNMAAAAERACKDLFRPNLNALRYDLKSEENPSKWRQAFVDAEQEILQRLIVSTEFNQHALNVIARAETALASGQKLGEWTVSKLETDANGNLTDYSIVNKIGAQNYRRTAALGTLTTLLLEKSSERIFLQADIKNGETKNVEVLVVENKKPLIRHELGVRPMRPTEIPLDVSPKEMMDLVLNPRAVAYASGPNSFVRVTAALQQLGEQTAKVDITKDLMAWRQLEDSYLKQAGIIRLRSTLKSIARLHEEQSKLSHSRTSHFIYDDRGSVSLVEHVKVPGRGIIEALPGSRLFDINDYGDVRMVFDLPRANDDSVRLWIWDGRNELWTESFMLPMNKKGESGTVEASSSTYLSLLFGRILNIQEQMELKNEELSAQ